MSNELCAARWMIAEKSENLLNENFMTACAFDETKDAKYSVDQKKYEEKKKKWKLCMHHMCPTEARRGEMLYLLEQ